MAALALTEGLALAEELGTSLEAIDAGESANLILEKGPISSVTNFLGKAWDKIPYKTQIVTGSIAGVVGSAIQFAAKSATVKAEEVVGDKIEKVSEKVVDKVEEVGKKVESKVENISENVYNKTTQWFHSPSIAENNLNSNINKYSNIYTPLNRRA